MYVCVCVLWFRFLASPDSSSLSSRLLSLSQYITSLKRRSQKWEGLALKEQGMWCHIPPPFRSSSPRPCPMKPWWAIHVESYEGPAEIFLMPSGHLLRKMDKRNRCWREAAVGSVNPGAEFHWQPSCSLIVGYFTIISTLHPGFYDSRFSVLLAASHHSPLGAEPGSCMPARWWTEVQLDVAAMLLPQLWSQKSEARQGLCLEWGQQSTWAPQPGGGELRVPTTLCEMPRNVKLSKWPGRSSLDDATQTKLSLGL